MTASFESLTLKFSGGDSFEVPLAGITVFVGPNSSGKSLVLKEFEKAMRDFNNPQSFKIIGDYRIKDLSDEQIAELFERLSNKANQEGVPPGQIRVVDFQDHINRRELITSRDIWSSYKINAGKKA